MGKINWARVFLGGLLSGLVGIILGAPVFFLIRKDWTAAMRALGLPFPTTQFILLFSPLMFFVVQ